MKSPTEIFSIGAALEDAGLLESWKKLHTELDASFFLTPDWTKAWWNWVGEPSGRIAIWRDDLNRLEALVALTRMQERLHPRFPMSVTTLTNLGSGAGAADHHGWLAKEDRVADVWGWLEEQIRDTSLLLRSLVPELWRSAPSWAKTVDRSPCPRMNIENGLDAIESSSFQKKIRYYKRRLDRERVGFHWIPPDRLSEDQIGLLFRLHNDRHSLKEEDSTFRRAQLDLHRKLIQTSSGRRDGPAAVIAETDGAPIGILYGFLSGSTFAYFQSGWLSKWAQYNLGTVLIAHAIERASDVGARTFDFLRGPEPYKYRFGAKDYTDATLLLSSGLSGRLLNLKYKVRQGRKDRTKAPPVSEDSG